MCGRVSARHMLWFSNEQPYLRVPAPLSVPLYTSPRAPNIRSIGPAGSRRLLRRGRWMSRSRSVSTRGRAWSATCTTGSGGQRTTPRAKRWVGGWSRGRPGWAQWRQARQQAVWGSSAVWGSGQLAVFPGAPNPGCPPCFNSCFYFVFHFHLPAGAAAGGAVQERPSGGAQRAHSHPHQPAQVHHRRLDAGTLAKPCALCTVPWGCCCVALHLCAPVCARSWHVQSWFPVYDLPAPSKPDPYECPPTCALQPSAGGALPPHPQVDLLHRILQL